MELNSPQSNRKEALKLGTHPLLIHWGSPTLQHGTSRQGNTVASGLAEPTILGPYSARRQVLAGEGPRLLLMQKPKACTTLVGQMGFLPVT